MEGKYEDKLYGKVEFLHERTKQNHLSLTNFSDIITKFINAISDFSKTIEKLNFRKSRIVEEKDTSIYHLTHFFKLNLKSHVDEFQECSQHLNTTIIEPVIKTIDEKYLKEKELYNNYHKIKNIYNNSKITLEKSKKEFDYNANLCEKNILSLNQIKSYNMNSSNDNNTKIEERMKLSIANAKTFENKYYQCLEEANKARENEINKQKELLNYYQIIDTDFYSKINCMISFIVPVIKKMYNSILKSLEGLEEQCKKVKIKEDIQMFIEKNKTDILPEEPIKFIPYYPEAKLESTISGNDRKDLENLDINYNVLLTLYENFREIRKDLNMDEEKKKHRLRFLCLKIFKIGPGVEFKKEEKDELISFFNEKSYKSYFLITLSKQRTKGRYQRSETLLKDLAEILNIILDSSEKEKDYESAKSCIILSQTFYFEKQKGKDKKKKYLLDYIKNHKWLKSLELWEGLTEFMIKKEIEKNEEINKKNNYSETPEQIKNRLSNIAFSQVISNSNSMIEFMFNKDDIIKVVDKFVKKYEIEKAIQQVIYDTIKNTPYQKNEDEEEDEIKEEKKEPNNKEKEQTSNKSKIIDDENKIEDVKKDNENENKKEEENIKAKEEINLDDNKKNEEKNEDTEKIEKENNSNKENEKINDEIKVKENIIMKENNNEQKEDEIKNEEGKKEEK